MNFIDPPIALLVIAYGIVEKDHQLEIQCMTLKDDLRTSALRCMQELCRFHGLTKPFVVQSVQKLSKYALVALVSSSDSKDGWQYERTRIRRGRLSLKRLLNRQRVNV